MVPTLKSMMLPSVCVCVCYWPASSNIEWFDSKSLWGLSDPQVASSDPLELFPGTNLRVCSLERVFVWVWESVCVCVFTNLTLTAVLMQSSDNSLYYRRVYFDFLHSFISKCVTCMSVSSNFQYNQVLSCLYTNVLFGFGVIDTIWLQCCIHLGLVCVHMIIKTKQLRQNADISPALVFWNTFVVAFNCCF